MKSNFLEELKWRGMVQDFTPEVEEYLNKNTGTAYVGIDPTADSLHIGHLVSVLMLKHFQNCGHKPILLLGGATGMIGDPSGKSKERNLLTEEILRHNEKGISKQLEKFLNFDKKNVNPAIVVNNYDWMKKITFLDFTRDIGKHITVNYMMSKDSVKKRLGQNSEYDGMSFTEFTYQMLQGYDFLFLNKEYNCKIQMGGSDQWGNITTGIEMIRKIQKGIVYGITCPLITKADGGKFGKTENGNIWLDENKTSPYKFYQFWFNVSDVDAEKYIKIFSFLIKEEIESLIKEHYQYPEKRILQKKIAEEITILVHSKEKLLQAIEASNILFGNATKESISKLSKNIILSVMEDVPQYEIRKDDLYGMSVVDMLSTSTGFLKSKSEARRDLEFGSISINFEKVNLEYSISSKDFIQGEFIFLRKGKKNYSLIKIV